MTRLKLNKICYLFLLFGWPQLVAENKDVIDLVAFPRPTMSTLKVTEKITIDGKIDELAWSSVDSLISFYQTQPNPGSKASERTVVRALYDDENLYISAMMYDSEPNKIIIESLEQDFDSQSSDCFAIMLDTFNDKKSGYAFLFNPAGAIKDMYINNNGASINRAWEGIVHRKTIISDKGWSIEMAFPISSLRFNPNAPNQDWGINFLRRIKRKSEDVYWSPIEPFEKLLTSSKAGTLTGLANLQPGQNIQIKPYFLGNQINEEEKTDKVDGGIDLKIGITPTLTFDFTKNTDFSQVDSDEEKVNLTRFPLFFPEKRDFFLENASIFEFGDISNYLYRMKPNKWSRSFNLFHSRRIGLENGEQIPINYGARLTGKIAGTEIGYLNMSTNQKNDIPLTDFNVLRLKKQILKRSNIGAMVIDRNSAIDSTDHRSIGIDANFTINKLLIYSYFATTENKDISNNNTVGRVAIAYRDSKWDLAAYYKKAEKDFSPKVGFIQRNNVGETFITTGVHKRFSSGPFLNLNPYLFINQFDNLDGYMESQAIKMGLDIQFMNGSQLYAGLTQTKENIKTSFELYGFDMPTGEYVFNSLSLNYRGDRTRRILINGSLNLGKYYNGDRNSIGTSIIFNAGYRFRSELGVNKNILKFPDTTIDADIYTLKLKYNHNVSLFNSLFFQYNAADDRLVSNFRFNLIHSPLSDLFIVYSNISELSGDKNNNGMIALKFTKLFTL